MIKVMAGMRLDMAVVNVTEVKAIASMFKFWGNTPLHIYEFNVSTLRTYIRQIDDKQI